MASSGIDVLEKAVDLLHQSNYRVYQIVHPDADFCFEFIAEHVTHQNPSLIVKIIDNIDNIKPPYIHEIKLLAHLVHALPILLANQNRRDPLEDNVVYSRKDILAINIKTFENILKTPQLPLAIAKQGGFFYDIDGPKLQELREKHDISRKEIADKLNVTPKAVSQYEIKNMRASREHTAIIQNLFNESIIIPTHFFEMTKNTLTPSSIEKDLERKPTVKTQEFIHMVNEIVSSVGFRTFWTRISPYDLLIYQEDDDTKELINVSFVGGAFFEKKMDPDNLQIKENFLGHQLAPQQPKAMVYDDETIESKTIKKDTVPYIKPKDLKYLEDPHEFKRIIKDRTKIRIDWDPQ
jgi:predicted transcriptional regulator